MTAKRFFNGIFLFLILLVVLDRISGAVLEYGIYKHFDLHSNVDYLVLGSSPATLDLSKALLEKRTGKKFAFYTQLGVTTEDRLIMLKHFLSINKSKLKGVIYELTPHIFTCKGLSENSNQLLFPYMNDKVIRDYLKIKCQSKLEYYERVIFSTSRFNEMTLNFAVRGIINDRTNLKFGIVDTIGLQKEIKANNFWKITMDTDCINTFRNTVYFLKQRQLNGTFVFFPVVHILTTAEPEKIKSVEQRVQEIVKINSGNQLLNYTILFKDSTNLFFDHLHLNVDGQKEFTLIFSKYFIQVKSSFNQK